MKEFAKKIVPVIVFATVLALTLTAAATSDSEALSANQLSIRPPYMSATVKQGDSFTQQIQLRHITETEKTVKVEARVRDIRRIEDKIIYLDESGLDNPAYSVSQWAMIEPGTIIELPPNKWVGFTVTVDVPEDAELGEHVAVINVRTMADEQISGTEMQVVTSLSPAFFVLVTDPEGHYDLHREWTLDGVKGKKWNGGDFTASVTNSGNVHVLIQPVYRVYDLWSNEMVAESALPLASILPGSSREVKLQWLNPRRFGLFRAEIEVTAVQDDHAEHFQTWFLRIPTLVLIVMLATFIIVFLLVQLYIRRTVQNKTERSSVKES